LAAKKKTLDLDAVIFSRGKERNAFNARKSVKGKRKKAVNYVIGQREGPAR